MVKAAVRGSSWQAAFFKALMVEWLTDIFMCQLGESLILDCWLPSVVLFRAVYDSVHTVVRLEWLSGDNEQAAYSDVQLEHGAAPDGDIRPASSTDGAQGETANAASRRLRWISPQLSSALPERRLVQQVHHHVYTTQQQQVRQETAGEMGRSAAPWWLRWIVGVSPQFLESTVSLLTTFVVAFSMQQSATGVTSLHRSVFVGNNTDTFSFGLTGSLCRMAQCSNVTTVVTWPSVVTVTKYSAPVVRIDDGTSAIVNVTTQEDLVLRGSAFVYVYVGGDSSSVSMRQSQLQYSWQFMSVSGGTTLSSTSSNPQILRIARGALSQWTRYNATLTVTDLVTGYTGHQVVYINVAPPSLVVKLVPSQREIVVTTGESFELDATGSFDPATTTSNRRRLTSGSAWLLYQWSCVSYLLVGGRRMSSSTTDCAVNMTKTATGKVLVETSPDFLSVNTSSVVTLTLRDDIAYQSGYDRYSSRSVTITMTSQPVASIRILSDVASFVRVVPSAAVTILAAVSNARQPGGGPNTTCKWFSSTLPFTATTVSASSLIQASIAPSKSVHMPLVIRAGALVAAGHYTFRLTCGSVWTEVSVSTNQAPYGGSMAVTPSTGLAFETSFVFSAVGWTDDISAQEDPSSFALTYTFQYSPTNAQWTTIPNFAGLTYVDDVVLPSGGLQNTTSAMLPLRLLVADAVGASTVFHTSVEFSTSSNLGGSISIAASSLGGNIAQKSSEVFTVFGCLWGFGLTYNGVLVQALTLEKVLGVDTDAIPSCTFNNNSSSMLASIISVIIVTALSAPMGLFLDFSFRAIRTPKKPHPQRAVPDAAQVIAIPMAQSMFAPLRRRTSSADQSSVVVPLPIEQSQPPATAAADVPSKASSMPLPAADGSQRRPSRQSFTREERKRGDSCDVLDDASSGPGGQQRRPSVTRMDSVRESDRSDSLCRLSDASTVTEVRPSRLSRCFARWRSVTARIVVAQPHIDEALYDTRQQCASMFQATARQQLTAEGDLFTPGTDKGGFSALGKRPSKLKRFASFVGFLQSDRGGGLLRRPMQIEKEHFQRLLQHADDGEYGVFVLLTLFADAMGTRSAARKLFMTFVADEYILQTSGATGWARFFTGLLVLLNLGALSFIALKGVSRGIAWQRNFLQGCLLDLIAEIVFVQIVEISWTDFLLPLLIHKEVTAVWKQLSRMADSFVSSAVRGKLVRGTAALATAAASTNPLESSASASASAWHLSYGLAVERAYLLESQLSVHYRLVEMKKKAHLAKSALSALSKASPMSPSPSKPPPHGERSRSDTVAVERPAIERRAAEQAATAAPVSVTATGHPPTPSATPSATPAAAAAAPSAIPAPLAPPPPPTTPTAAKSWRVRFIDWFVRIPLELHRFIVCVSAAVFLGGVATLWYTLKDRPHGALYLAAVLGGGPAVVVGALYRLYVVSDRRQRARLTRDAASNAAAQTRARAGVKVLSPTSRWILVREKVLSGHFRSSAAPAAGGGGGGGGGSATAAGDDSKSSWSESLSPAVRLAMRDVGDDDGDDGESDEDSLWLSSLGTPSAVSPPLRSPVACGSGGDGPASSRRRWPTTKPFFRQRGDIDVDEDDEDDEGDEDEDGGDAQLWSSMSSSVDSRLHQSLPRTKQSGRHPATRSAVATAAASSGASATVAMVASTVATAQRSIQPQPFRSEDAVVAMASDDEKSDGDSDGDGQREQPPAALARPSSRGESGGDGDGDGDGDGVGEASDDEDDDPPLHLPPTSPAMAPSASRKTLIVPPMATVAPPAKETATRHNGRRPSAETTAPSTATAASVPVAASPAVTAASAAANEAPVDADEPTDGHRASSAPASASIAPRAAQRPVTITATITEAEGAVGVDETPSLSRQWSGWRTHPAYVAYNANGYGQRPRFNTATSDVENQLAAEADGDSIDGDECDDGHLSEDEGDSVGRFFVADRYVERGDRRVPAPAGPPGLIAAVATIATRRKSRRP
eukprot:gene6791-4897_t